MSASVDIARREGGIAVVRLQGEIDASNAKSVAAGLERALTGAESALIVDLSGVDYMGSSGVHLLHELARRLEGEGRRLRLVAAGSPIVERLFGLVSMDRLIPVDASVDDALAALAAQ